MLWKGHTSDYDVADIKWERSTSDYAVSEIRGRSGEEGEGQEAGAEGGVKVDEER